MQSIASRLSAPLRACLAPSLGLVLAAAALVACAAPGRALPKVQKVVSPAGIEAWLMELHDAPLITLRMSFASGTQQDAPGKFGTATLTSYMFDEGAGPYDSAELKRRLVRIGAAFGAGASYEYLTVSFATPSARKQEALELLRLALAEPRFDPEPLARARTYYLNGIQAAQKNPSNVASLALRQRVFGKHPLAIDWATRKAGYESVERADIEAFRRRLLARDNLKIAVAGDIDAATLGPMLDRLLGSLPAKAEPLPVPTPAGTAGSCQLTAMEVPQAVVQFASLAPRLTWRQRLAWWLLESILDEGVSSGRLSRELREKRGLVYGIGTDYTHFASFGLFEGAFGAKMGEVPQAIALTRAELRRMVEEGPTEEEVATVKPAIIGRTLLGLDTGAAIANLILGMQLNDQPTTYLDDIAGEIESITRADVWEVAKLVLDPDRLAVSVVGQPTADVCAAAAGAE
jgi:zinc protease